MSRYGLISRAAVACSLIACGGDPATGPDAAVERTLEHVSSASLEVEAGATVPGPTVRLVEKPSGKPVADVTVEFLLRPMSGSIDNVLARTDANGVASAGLWSLFQSGVAVIDVRASGLRISFSANVKPAAPAQIRAVDSTIAWLAGEEIEPIVVAMDRFGNPTPGARITFAVAAGGGQISRTEATTSANGRASPGSWRLGATPGDNVLSAAFDGSPPAAFRVLGLDRSSLSWYDLDRIGPVEMPTALLQRGAVGFTPFERCICTDGMGWFVMEIIEVASPTSPAGATVKIAGVYRIQPPAVRLVGAGQEVSATVPGFGNIYAVRDQLRPLGGGRITLEVWRWYPQGSGWFAQTWSFAERE